ncbi:MAG: YceI family protein [Mycobacterium sp.]
MTPVVWSLDSSDGELLIRTGVTGRAARMGHRLTIAMTRWRATVQFDGADPVAVEVVIETDSFEVLRGEGGVKGLSGPEKALVRSNALKALDAKRFPRIRFAADVVDRTDEGYRLTGALEVRGKAREHVIDLRTDDLGDSRRVTTESTVRQSDHGVKPYSLLIGSVQVADDVSVSFTAVHAKDE